MQSQSQKAFFNLSGITMDKKVRVRFAPSPTGGLHIGGVRTILFNYIFAKRNNGDFVLRIEDTDQTRYVPGAEEYIINCLKWCGLNPDEGPHIGGDFAPYRQSERKPIYKQYAEELVKNEYAYYAFDTAEELENARNTIENFRYDKSTRMSLRNSLTLPEEEVQKLLAQNVPYVVRIKVPEDQNIHFTDLIRGHVSFDSNEVDDKVLLKADGMPTYHLAVVVDDYLMKITHAFRGEEWLPSAPIHILLWKYLGWEEDMPEWAHLPLILKPDGHGKLSKRDGKRLGFPVYAMNWTDPATQELAEGFKEVGFLPEAFLNMLAMLGWNDGTDQELFSLDELCEKFSLERVNKAGAKFDYEKAKWFNAEWIKKSSAKSLYPYAKEVFDANGVQTNEEYLIQVIDMVKERCILLPDFYQQASFFFEAPQHYDLDAVKPKWNSDKTAFFEAYIHQIEAGEFADAVTLEAEFKQLAADKGLKIGEVMLPFRIMLVGGKFGPQVFDIALALGRAETIKRIEKALPLFQ